MAFRYNPFSGQFEPSGVNTTTLDSRYVNVTGDTMTGSLGINVAPLTNTLSVYKTTTDTTGNIALFDADFLTTVTGDRFNKALSGTAWGRADLNTTNTGYNIGLHFASMNDGLGTIDDVRGIWVQYGNYLGAGVTTDAIGISLNPYVSAGTIGNLYHIKIQNKTSGGTISGAEYSLYSAQTARLTHVGAAIFGTLQVPVGNLDVSATTGGVLAIRRNDASVTANDMIGKIAFYTNDTSTTTNLIAASIEAQATNTVATDINPGRMIFSTTGTDVAGALTERLRIDAAGNIDATANLRNTGYLRIGSTAAPTNTTAGDITGVRLSIGNASLATDIVNISSTISTASANARGLNMVAMTFTGAGDGPAGAAFQPEFLPSANLTLAYGFINIAKGSPDTGITITNMHAAANRIDTGNLAGAITNAQGLTILRSSLGTLKPGSMRGIQVQDIYPTASSTGTTNIIGLQVDGQHHGSNITEGIRITMPSAGTGMGNVTNSNGISIPTASVTLGNTTATTTHQNGINLGIITYTSTTNTRTLTNASTLYIAGAPVASTNVTITTGPYSIWVDGGTTRLDGELNAQGDINHDGTNVGFYGVAPVARQLLATGAGATVDQVITALQTLGLLRQT